MIIINNKQDFKTATRNCKQDMRIYKQQAKYFMRKQGKIGAIRLDDESIVTAASYKKFCKLLKIHLYETDVVWFHEVEDET